MQILAEIAYYCGNFEHQTEFPSGSVAKILVLAQAHYRQVSPKIWFFVIISKSKAFRPYDSSSTYINFKPKVLSVSASEAEIPVYAQAHYKRV